MRPRYVFYPLHFKLSKPIPVVDTPGIIVSVVGMAEDDSVSPRVRFANDHATMLAFLDANCQFGCIDLDMALPKEMKGT